MLCVEKKCFIEKAKLIFLWESGIIWTDYFLKREYIHFILEQSRLRKLQTVISLIFLAFPFHLIKFSSNSCVTQGVAIFLLSLNIFVLLWRIHNNLVSHCFCITSVANVQNEWSIIVLALDVQLTKNLCELILAVFSKDFCQKQTKNPHVLISAFYFERFSCV